MPFSNLTPSALKQIQPTIQRFTKMLANIMQLEVEIVDADLVRMAGTGPYAKSVGVTLNNYSRLLRHVLESKTEKVVVRSRTDPMCASCTDRSNCMEKAFIGIPILVQDVCLGVISLVALTDEQQKRIEENNREISDYARHISTIFVSKIVGVQSNADELTQMLIGLVDHMDQGVVGLDKNGQVKFINATALEHLGCTQEKIAGRLVEIEPLTPTKIPTQGHSQYIFSFADKQAIISGQMIKVHELELFLMAYHQSPLTLPEGHSQTDPRVQHIIGESPPMRALKALIARIATSPSSVLIRGESGTGKEIVARAIHQLSDRQQQAFVAINCAAIPENLQESELFGYVKGAFTGASATGKVGLIQAANGGTLFLDEVGDMPLTLQAKLLRAIESREVQPIGSNKSFPVDIRIISATHQNLDDFVAQGKFRGDLYYRLSVIPISVPALRERKSDIDLLVHYFINLHAKRISNAYPGIAPDVLEQLRQYNWPGNVRELSNLAEYLVNVVPPGELIDVSLLPPSISPPQTPRPTEKNKLQETQANFCEPETGTKMLKTMERQIIEEALFRLGNKKLVADELGIGIATLYRKIKKYGLSNFGD